MRLISSPAVIAIVFLFVIGLAIPSGAFSPRVAQSVDETTHLELSSFASANGQYATIDDGRITINLEKLNDGAITHADNVFTITVTNDVERIWIENDVPGLTFYRGDDPTYTISRSDPLEPPTHQTTSIGVAVDTHEAVSGTETFTIVAQYEDEDNHEPNIEGSSLNVSPTTFESGEPVTVNATYRNNGDKRGMETAQLTVDGTVVDQRSIELRPGEERAVSFERTMYWPGTYDVGLEGVGTESVTVEGPPIDVVNTSIDDSTITAGESATIRATVSNPTDMRVERTLELAVDGIVVDSRSMSIPANGERTVTFERRFAAVGTYDVAVSGVSAGTVTVEEREPFSIRNRELSAATTAALAPPATAGLLALAVVANRRWAILQ